MANSKHFFQHGVKLFFEENSPMRNTVALKLNPWQQELREVLYPPPPPRSHRIVGDSCVVYFTIYYLHRRVFLANWGHTHM